MPPPSCRRSTRRCSRAASIRYGRCLARWLRRNRVLPPQVHRWSYADARDYLLRAGDLISAEQAERRVLIMENPRPAGIVLRHDKSLRRLAVDLAGRNRPLPPPRPKRAALRDGGRRRFHRGRWREGDDASVRSGSDPGLAMARPRQHVVAADDLAGRARHPDRAAVRRQLRRTSSGIRPSGNRSAGRYGAALRPELASDARDRSRSPPRPPAAVPLSVYRVAGKPAVPDALRRSGPAFRLRAGVHQSGRRRCGNADDLRPCAAAAGRIHVAAAGLHRWHDLRRGGRKRYRAGR